MAFFGFNPNRRRSLRDSRTSRLTWNCGDYGRSLASFLGAVAHWWEYFGLVDTWLSGYAVIVLRSVSYDKGTRVLLWRGLL